MENTNIRSANSVPAAERDLSSEATPALALQRPFVERRKADRRRTDRRSQAPRRDTPQGAGPECTSRERQIVELLLQGMTNKQIARTLDIAEGTVKKHLYHVYKKLGVQRRALLIVDNVAAMQPSRRLVLANFSCESKEPPPPPPPCDPKKEICK